MGPDSMVRLYVGGLPGDVSPEQVAQRFQPFGTITAVELVPEKAVVTAMPRSALKACRGFAYVQLAPKDAAALHRCISMVRTLACRPANMGTRWSSSGHMHQLQESIQYNGMQRRPCSAPSMLVFDESL